MLGRDPLEIERLTRSLCGYLGFRGSGVETRAVSAFDIGLWDLYGKVCGQPLYQVLGGASREAIRTYNTCAGYRYIRDARQQASSNGGSARNRAPTRTWTPSCIAPTSSPSRCSSRGSRR